MKKWYNKFYPNGQKGTLNCPNCDFEFQWEKFYAFETHECPKCKTELLKHWQVSVIYTIDISRAPEIMKIIYRSLKEKTQKESFDEIKELRELFGSE